MRCDDVIHELATPTAGGDPAALADHLAICPSCARSAANAARFDRLWEATRPVEPSVETWDALWANVSARLDVPVEVALETADLPPGRDLIAFPVAARRSWRSRELWAFSLAQAACLLLAFGLLLGRAPEPAGAALVRVDIEAGEQVIIRDKGQVDRRDAYADAPQDTLDDNYAMLNAFEAMAKAKDL
jgi:DNA-binding helix-hairpin-helix protein with protein kinase domain